ncbi:MAG: hypothetical protein KJO95_09995 [Gammaproteobacteria bacterium]|nr:hypothetical protein [Gammaproteobacteria bacterium]
MQRDFATWVIAALLTISASPSAIAADIPARWDAELPIYLTATMHYRSVDSAHDWRTIASILAELRFRHGDRAWSIGPVVEIHRTVNGRNDAAVASGIIFRHEPGYWDTTALVYRQMTRHAPDSWNYGARLRYRMSSTAKLGAEAYGALDDLGSSSLWFGYYRDVSRALSFRLLAGTNVDRLDVRLLRLDVVLQVR